MALTFGSMATSPCSSLRAAPTLSSPALAQEILSPQRFCARPWVTSAGCLIGTRSPEHMPAAGSPGSRSRRTSLPGRTRQTTKVSVVDNESLRSWPLKSTSRSSPANSAALGDKLAGNRRGTVYGA